VILKPIETVSRRRLYMPWLECGLQEHAVF